MCSGMLKETNISHGKEYEGAYLSSRNHSAVFVDHCDRNFHHARIQVFKVKNVLASMFEVAVRRPVAFFL